MSSGVQGAETGVILAAGGVLCRGAGEVMVVHRKQHRDWSLPKGKLEPGETFEQAALREVREETGYTAALGEYLGAFGYETKARPKVVLFWRMSPVEEHAPEHPEEIERAVWMSADEAFQRLTHRQERELLAHVFPRKQVVGVKQQARLGRALQEFDIELAFLEHRNAAPAALWPGAARAHLAAACRSRDAGDTDGAWQALHAAQRATMYGLERDELAVRATVLRTESQKLTNWRSKAIAALLAVPDEELTHQRVVQAALIRDEDAANRYSRIQLMADQVKLLFRLVSVGTLVLGAAILWVPREGPANGWEYPLVAAILLFGLLGACFSAAQSLIGSTNNSPIPERIANRHVTIARVVFGAIAGLAGYTFIQSRVINVQFGDNTVAAGLTIAFLFGYTGDRAIARVADIVGGGTAK
jgi:8-oxo-dGTP diphosphatase